MKMSKKLKKQVQKAQQQMPTVPLKDGDFVVQVEPEQKIELIIHWKGGQRYQPEHLGPVHAYGLKDGKFKVINRLLLDTAYTFDVAEIHKIYVMPLEI